MQLNLPILDQLKDSQNILIAGAGGGFDVFAGLPIYFTLREMGKTVHLANYSFTEIMQTKYYSEPNILISNLLVGAKGYVQLGLSYYPEGYLAQWFLECGENVTVWMFHKTGVQPLIEAYNKLIDELGVDAIILIDGGVDSIMRGDEMGVGTIVEDTISLAAVGEVAVPTKLLACIGFGTEVEERVSHHSTLENIAALTKAGGFLGACSLAPQMKAFQLFEKACRYVWEQPHPKSHISTRIIPAARGEFGNYHMYPNESHREVDIFVSPLMSLYWFFDTNIVIECNLLVDAIRETYTSLQAFNAVSEIEQTFKRRPHQPIPY